MKTRISIFAVTLVTVSTAISANLLVNPGAEDGLSGWITTGTPAQINYGTGGGWPVYSSPGPPDRGDYFWDGGSATNSSISQVVDLSGLDWVGVGDYSFSASGWLGGYSTQLDYVTITIQFLDEEDAALGTLFTVGPVTAVDRDNVTGLYYRELVDQAVPFGAQSAVFTLDFEAFSPHNDGYADNVSFEVSAVPEPGVVLLAGMAPLGTILVRRRKTA